MTLSPVSKLSVFLFFFLCFISTQIALRQTVFDEYSISILVQIHTQLFHRMSDVVSFAFMFNMSSFLTVKANR